MHEIKKIINEIEEIGYKVKNFSNLTTGINSSTFKIEGYQKKYLLKIYNASRVNPINRLEHENTFLTFLKACKFENVPQIIEESFLYQKTPSFRIHLPDMMAVSEFHCDTDENYNHPIGEINFIMPLTDMWDTNAVWAESERMKGDYRPMNTNFGQLLKFNGNMCRHGNKTNKTSKTRMSFDFRVLPISCTPAKGMNPVKFNSGSVYTKAKWEAGGYYKLYDKTS